MRLGLLGGLDVDQRSRRRRQAVRVWLCPFAEVERKWPAGFDWQLVTRMYGPAAFRNRDRAWVSEVADMYPACLIGSRAVALMGIRTHRWSY